MVIILCWPGALCFIPAFVWDSHAVPWVSVYGVMLFYLGGGLMVLGSISRAKLGRMGMWLADLGRHSYSVYLWNGFVYEVILVNIKSRMGPHWNNWLEFLTCFVLTWTVGIAAAKLFEIPLLKLRQRFMP